MRVVAIFTLLAVVLNGCSQNKAHISKTSAVKEYAAGMVRMEFSDPDRRSWSGTTERPLVTYIWYPAAVDAEMTELIIPPDSPIFIGGKAAWNAEAVQGSGSLPLILASHGTGGSALQMMWLGSELAKLGYVVAAVDHHGNSAAEDTFDARGFKLPWERAADLSVVADHVLADPVIGPLIDTGRIGAVGFSLGGYSVLSAAGAITDLERLERFCESQERDTVCDPQIEYPQAEEEFAIFAQNDPVTISSLASHGKSYGDERIKAVVALAPALGQALTEDSLAGIDIPALIITGTEDITAPAETNTNYLAGELPDVRVVEYSGAGHYVFLNSCTERGKQFVPVCKDAANVDRAQLHQETVKTIAAFFSTEL